jgi:dihydrofolate reductase
MHALVQQDLTDEYRIWVQPIVVRSGKRLLEEGGEPKVLKLVDSTTLGSGAVVLSYQPPVKQGKG